MHKEVRIILQDIKSLKIQGARNVAKASLRAIAISIEHSKAKTVGSLYHELIVTANLLSYSRPTEPMMRNLIMDVCRFALLQIRTKKSRTAQELKKTIRLEEKKMLEQMDQDVAKLVSYGAELIPNNSLILTHCHSSTSTKILIEAKRRKKKFSVTCFETRPMFQGRTTATELASAGLDVTLAVDGAMSLFVKKADLAIVGADSISSKGDLVNKIGTSTLAHLAAINDVPFYSAAELYKYSPLTRMGIWEKIEERDPEEVWKGAPKKIKIKNPAFEIIPSKYLSGYISELGIIPPQSLFSIASGKLGIKLDE